MPIEVQASVQVLAGGSPGETRIALDGSVVLAGLSAVFTHARSSTPGDLDGRSTAIEVPLIPPGEWFTLSGSLTRAPVARGSPLLIQFRDRSRLTLTGPLRLAQADGHGPGFGLSFHVPVAVALEFAGADGGVGSGSRATLGGRITFPEGIFARFAFRAEGARTPGSLLPMGEATIAAIPAGASLPLSDHVLSIPAPSSPFASLAFRDGHGYPLKESPPDPGLAAHTRHRAPLARGVLGDSPVRVV